MRGLVVRDRQVVLVNDLPMPSPANGEVLVEVAYSSINPTDLDMIRGRFDWLLALVRKQSRVRTGFELAGTVQSDGKRFARGDRVFGFPDVVFGSAAHQQYVCIDEDYLAASPPGIEQKLLAGVPVAAMSALQAVEDLARAGRGTTLLIIGASGGLGVCAVQIARALGADVTATAAPAHHDAVMHLGANRVLDHSAIDGLDRTFDAVIDLSATLRFGAIRRLLSEGGAFIPADGFKNARDFVSSWGSGRRVRALAVSKGNHDVLTRIASWLAAGTLRPIVDSEFALADYRAAFERFSVRGKLGKVVLRMSE